MGSVLESLTEKKKERKKVAMDYNQWVQLAESSQIAQHEQRSSSSLDDWVKDRPSNPSQSAPPLDINEFTTLGDLGGKLSLCFSPFAWALIPSWIYPIYKLPQPQFLRHHNPFMRHSSTTTFLFRRPILLWRTDLLLGQFRIIYLCQITQA